MEKTPIITDKGLLIFLEFGISNIGISLVILFQQNAS